MELRHCGTEYSAEESLGVIYNLWREGPGENDLHLNE